MYKSLIKRSRLIWIVMQDFKDLISFIREILVSFLTPSFSYIFAIHPLGEIFWFLNESFF